jgi:altronate dehydratase
MDKIQTAFQINVKDNVATALCAVDSGVVILRGETFCENVIASESIPAGHKIALGDIQPGEDVVKYGVVIGRSTALIHQGGWVHLHCIRSIYDERSSHLDVVTGVPTDTKYE